MNRFLAHPLLGRCVLIGLSLLLLTHCSTPTPPTSTQLSTQPVDVFPFPSELTTQVDFWRNVFAHWSQSQVVLHDDRHLDLIYDVIKLPGNVDDRYTKTQRAYVRVRQKELKKQLQTLEKKLANGDPLLAPEQQLHQRISSVAGIAAINGAAERLRSQRGIKERFKRGLERSGRYLPEFRRIFREAGLPEDLAYLPHVESSFQALAQSSAGAVGMWQFTRGAAKEFMTLNQAVDERLDPIASAHGATRYLSLAYELLDDWALAVTSYNHGIGSMRQAKRRFGTDFVRIVREYDRPSFGFASRNFYAEFLAAREVALTPERFFPEGIRYQRPLHRDRVRLVQTSKVNNLSLRYHVDKTVLAELNPAWRKAALSGNKTLPTGIEVWLPPGTLAAYVDRYRVITGPELSMLLPPFDEQTHVYK